MEFDIIIKNGLVIDGTGARPRRQDVGIQREKISVIGSLDKARAVKTIDARGMTVSPGFIDIHGHTDISLLICPGADSKIMQGITTEVGGNCGDSPGPLSDRNMGDYSKEAERYRVTLDWLDLGGFLARLEGNISINYATLLGLGTLRGAVVGCLPRPATSREKKRMTELAEESLSQGAYGISTGLTYAPGMYADTDELSELAKALSRDAVIYATHMRGEGRNILSALEEAARISDRSGIPLQISHLKTVGRENWGKMPDVLLALDKACDSGTDIWADRYPYTASATGLASILPAWSHVGGRESLLERLKNEEEKNRLSKEVNENLSGLGWDRIILTNTWSPGNRDLEGRSIAEGARSRKMEPFDLVAHALLASDGVASIVAFSQDEDDMLLTLTHPRVMVGSDSGLKSPSGVLGEGKPHPRCYGAFPAFYRLFVREKRLLAPEEAVRKMTGMPAERLRLDGRGLLKKGFWADVAVFDQEILKDTATYENPHSYPRGIEYVIVNGEIAVERGAQTGSRSGRVLRRGA